MNIGYTIALIMGAVWLVFKMIEIVKARRNEKMLGQTVISSDEQLKDIIISENSDD